MPVLIALMGLRGCGKTTLADHLAELAPRLHRLSRDEVRGQLFSSPDYSSAEKRAIFSELLDLAERELRAGRDVLIDGMTFSRASERERAKPAAEFAGAELMLVHCDCPLDVAVARVRRDLAAGTHPAADRDEDAVRQSAAHFAPIPSNAFRLDMTRPGDELARELKVHIERERPSR